jgi:hypothetical protein
VTKTTGDAQKRARAEQRKPCCEGYVGMATFNAQVCLDRDATLRKVLVKHEALEEAPAAAVAMRKCEYVPATDRVCALPCVLCSCADNRYERVR